MKFYQTIVLMILCIMFTPAIFGAAEGTAKLPYLGSDVYDLIKEFRGEDFSYKQTAHIKPIPSYLSKLTGRLSFFAVSVSTLLVLLHIKSRGLADMSRMKLGIEALSLLSSPILFLVLINKIIDRGISGKYTYIKSPPQDIRIQDDLLTVQGSKENLSDGTTRYRTETRFLSNMNLKSKQLEECTRFFDKNQTVSRTYHAHGWYYFLTDGQVNMLLPESEDEEDEIIVLPTTERVTVFDVSNDGKIIVTGGKDGIRKWELQEAEEVEEVEEILEKLYE